MIYLFTNRGYGTPFRKRAAALARSGGTGLTVVFSARRSRRGLMQRAGFALRERTRAIDVPDVNAPAFLDRIRDGDCGVVAGFNQIFRAEAIARFRILANFHPSILPLYRGPVPSHWCLENGEAWTGFTLHVVTERIDAGEILYQDKVATEGVRDAAELDRRIASCAVPVFERFLAHLRDGGAWETRTLDAKSIYTTHVDYASFPTAT